VQLAWIIAFVSSIISATSGARNNNNELILFPNYSWWTLVFMFFVVVGVTVTVASGADRTYHVAVSDACLHAHNRMHLLTRTDCRLS
jgi:SHO1 osmosensor